MVTETVPVINACVDIMIRSWMRVMNSVVAVAELVSVIRPVPGSELPWLPCVIFNPLSSAYLALCHAARRARNLYYAQLRSISASLTNSRDHVAISFARIRAASTAFRSPGAYTDEGLSASD